MNLKYLIYLFLVASVTRLISSECPEKCKCERKPENGIILVVDCSNLNMTEIRKLPSLINTKYIGIELNIQRNKFSSLPNSKSTLGYDNVIMINATRNEINTMLLKSIPPKLKVLDVSHNNLTAITTDIKERIKQDNIKTYIAGNPWVGTCSSLEFRQSNTNLEHFVENGVTCKTETFVEKNTLAKNKYICHVIILILVCTLMFLLGILLIWKFCQKFTEQSYTT